MRSMLSWHLSDSIAGIGQLRKKNDLLPPLPLKLYRKTQLPRTTVCMWLLSRVTCVKGIGWPLSLSLYYLCTCTACPYKHTRRRNLLCSWRDDLPPFRVCSLFSSRGPGLFFFSSLKQELLPLWWDGQQSLKAASHPKRRALTPETRKLFKTVFSHRSSSTLNRLLKYLSGPSQKDTASITMYPWRGAREALG